MKLKAAHHWDANGDVIVTLRDHDAEEKRTQFRHGRPDTYNVYATSMHVRTVKVLERFRYPRGIAGKELAALKRTLVRAVALREETKAHDTGR